MNIWFVIQALAVLCISAFIGRVAMLGRELSRNPSDPKVLKRHQRRGQAIPWLILTDVVFIEAVRNHQIHPPAALFHIHLAFAMTCFAGFILLTTTATGRKRKAIHAIVAYAATFAWAVTAGTGLPLAYLVCRSA